jgi:hypothetical protein
MTLINTIVSNYGLIQASDSNITRSDSAEPTSGPKVFQLGFTNAALALAGTYRVGSQRMDTWMPRCISDYAASPQPTLEGFANYLKDRLDRELNDRQRAVSIQGWAVGCGFFPQPVTQLAAAGSQGLPASAWVMASRAVRPWLAAESR